MNEKDPAYQAGSDLLLTPIPVSDYREDRLANQSPSYDTDEASATDWRLRAACQGVEPSIFFPDGVAGRPRFLDPIAEVAKVICRDCPSREPCLRYALETNQEDGIWGGTDEAERRRLRKTWLAQQRRERVA